MSKGLYGSQSHIVRSMWGRFRRQVVSTQRQAFQPNVGKGVKARFAHHQPLQALGDGP